MIEIYKDYKITIVQDEDASMDNCNDNIFLVYDHRNFSVEKEHFNCREIFDYLNYPEKPEFTNLVDKAISMNEEDPEEYAIAVLENWENNKPEDYSEYHIWTVYAYIHSGIVLSLETTSYPFTDRWDVSTTGFVLAKKDAFINATTSKHLTKEEVEKHAKILIEVWNIYLSGDVLMYTIEKPISYIKIKKQDFNIITNSASSNYKAIENISKEEIEYEHVDSCGRFFNSEEELLTKCKQIIDNLCNTL